MIDEAGRRAFETDALTAYRRPPLAVVLPRTTEEVAAALRFCREQGVNVVPRGAGTSLAGGAVPQEDAIVVGLSKMNRILESNYADRYARVEAGVTNLAISEAAAPDGFFYAPDPSSQLACTIGGNIAMNSGGAHCLKYGVTINNLLGVRLVTFDGEVVDIGGPALDPGGLDFLGLICGAEGQLGIVTEAWVRILRLAEGARPVLFGFDSARGGEPLRGGHHRRRDRAGGDGIYGQARHRDHREFRPRRLSARCGGDADRRGRGLASRDGGRTARSPTSRARMACARSANRSRRWRARRSGRAASRRSARRAASPITSAWTARCRPGDCPKRCAASARSAPREGLRVANVFHAGDGNMHPLILYNVNDPAEQEKAERAGAEMLAMSVELGGCLTGEHGVGMEKRDLMTSQYSGAELAQQKAVRAVFDPDGALQSGQGVPAREAA